MKNTSLRYTPLSADVVEMTAGETFRFVQEVASSSFGFFGLGGGTTMLEGAVVGRTFTSPGAWCPNDAIGGWSNDDVGHADMVLEAMPAGAKWLCLSRNLTGNREVTHMIVNGDALVPSNHGFIVATGSVMIGELLAAELKYVRPREDGVAVFGTADLLLIK